MGPEDGRKAKTVEKALVILVEFMKGPPLLGISDLSTRAKFPRAVVQRVVNSLRSVGFLEQDPKSKRYTLGLRVLELGATAANYNRLMIAAQPVMNRLNDVTREATLLSVIDRRTWRGAYISLLDALEPSVIRPKLQQQGYLHASSTRKVLLAHLAPDEIDYVIRKVGLPRLTSKTIATPNALLAELERIKRDGYAVSRGEAYAGTSGVAAPIRDKGGAVVASLGVSVPDTRLNEARLKKLRQLVVKAAAEISASLNRLG